MTGGGHQGGTPNPREGRPTYIANEPRFYNATERTLNDSELMQLKVFQLWKTTQRMDRRNNVYSALMMDEVNPNADASELFLGQPFPVIEPNPTLWETFQTVRWYEHLISWTAPVWYNMWIQSKPKTRNAVKSGTRMAFFFGNASLFTWFFIHRAFNRLTGAIPNEYECYKYGVLETPQRLAKKAELWQKFSSYKIEWVRRFNYHAWGIRPGEEMHMLTSPCWFPAYPARFNVKTDYPPRKNPLVLASVPLHKFNKMEGTIMSPIPRRESEQIGPIFEARPEYKHLWVPDEYRGNLDVDEYYKSTERPAGTGPATESPAASNYL